MKNSAEKIKELEDKIQARDAVIESLKQELNSLQEQIILYRKAMYGSKTERTVIPDQLEINLFNEAETEATPIKTEPELNIKVSSHSRKPSKKRNIDDLPETVVEHDIEDKTDPQTGKPLRLIGTNERKELVHHKEYYEVIRHIQYVYASDYDEKIETTPMYKGDMPSAVIPKSFASPSLLASIIDKKFNQSLPLYRQQQAFERLGIILSRQTMANWIIKLYDLYFHTFVEHMHKELVKADYISADETTLEVLELKKNEGRQKSYMWVYKTGRSEEKKMVIYQFENDRKHHRASDFLEGYQGIIQSDGYKAYHDVEGVRNMGCFAHLRRKFVETMDVAPKGTDIKNTETYKMYQLLNKLFHQEKVYDKKYKNNYDRITDARKKYSLPILDEFYQKVKAVYPHSVEKTHLYEALTYAINNEKYLRYYIEDGRVEISNNATERCCKAFVIGRKNFLFSNSINGAKASGAAYSIVESAKMNDLKPYDYLEYILTRMSGAQLTGELLEDIMPWSKTLPQELYKNKKA
ncbi:IS66 family transposase [[Clostridium] spiroforme]|nr:IS66 family transposase [Thomasclavelia spiroformis]